MRRLCGVGFIGIILLVGLNAAPSFAQSENRDKPDRLVEMAVEYSGVEIPPDEDISMDITFYNHGRRGESVDVWIAEKPENWKARIKTYRYVVSGVHIPSDNERTLTFEAEPEKGIPPGTYHFKIEAQTPDKRFQMANNIEITIREKLETVKKDKGVKLITSYPVLRGPTDKEFEFSVEVESELDKDAVFNLLSKGPEGWDINFKPAYESKYISSLRLKANDSSTLGIEVKPPANAQAGEYPVAIRVHSDEAQGEAELMVILTGTYDFEVGTPSGLLSLEARQGKPANMSFYVRNTGSAPQTDVKFMSFKPENWNVEFKPERIDVIEPNDLKQIEVVITPYEEALVGDYLVTVNVEGERKEKPLEFRVTVKASAAWAWIGIGIILAVVLGLATLFRMFGRR